MTKSNYRGSVKSNVGHLEGASGATGIIKAILALEKGIIPVHTLFENLNPEINAKLYNIQVRYHIHRAKFQYRNSIRSIPQRCSHFGHTSKVCMCHECIPPPPLILRQFP
jgi:hypothetical protein